jgi:predicted TIM-barrel fold metal-dependent hydrolase
MNNPVPRIVDAHHHLWKLDAVHYPWLMERGVRRFFGDPTPIQQDYVTANFEDDIGTLPVTHSVHIQVGATPPESVRETQWLQECAEEHGKPSAIVAFADLSAPDVADVLDAHQAYRDVRGIRQIIGRHSSEDGKTGSGNLLSDATWLKNLAALSSRNLSFDLQLVPPQLPAIIRILERCPELRVAVCHAGSPWDQSPDGLKFWKTHMQRLSELPNVYCKLSGFGMFDHEWSARSIKPITDHVLDCFGSNRSMFGSNFPVDKLYRDYQSLYAAYFEVTEGLTDDEKAAVFAETSASFYRIPI